MRVATVTGARQNDLLAALPGLTATPFTATKPIDDLLTIGT
jgi:hypothetical protein